jgi:hypothetical protein
MVCRYLWVHNPGVGRRHFQRMAVVALLWTGLAAPSGCETLTKKSCNEIGCGFGFAVAFQPTDGIWRPGRYLVDVRADGVSSSCEVTLPLAPCGTPSSTCTGQRSWILGESGCALPASQHSISGISFSSSTPATVEVTVSRDGRQLAGQSFTPSYASSRPNGPDCEPTCRTAPTATLALLP